METEKDQGEMRRIPLTTDMKLQSHPRAFRRQGILAFRLPTSSTSTAHLCGALAHESFLFGGFTKVTTYADAQFPRWLLIPAVFGIIVTLLRTSTLLSLEKADKL